MKIVPVKKTPLFDVFVGEGWSNHSRVIVDKNKRVKLISGNRLTKIEFIEISKTVSS